MLGQVDARIGKMLIYGAMFQCLDPVLTIAAALSSRSPFVAPFDKVGTLSNLRSALLPSTGVLPVVRLTCCH